MTSSSESPEESKLGMVMVIRNEEDFLRAHLAYHQWIGVDRCYLFLHECTDASEKIAREFPWVKSIRLEGKCSKKFNYISEIHRLAMDQALTWARQDGINWLLIIDADEFVVAGAPNPFEKEYNNCLQKNSLKKLFEDIPKWIVQVKLSTWETLPLQSRMNCFFYENEVFVNPDGYTRIIKDELKNQEVKWKGFLGHRQGQTFVRVNAPVQAYDSHRWTIMQSLSENQMLEYIPLPTMERGWHVHYYIVSSKHWREKFVKHNDFPEHWPGKDKIPLEDPVKIWRHCVANWKSNVEQIERYCYENVFVCDEVVEMGLEKGILARFSGLNRKIQEVLILHHELQKRKKRKKKIIAPLVLPFSSLGKVPMIEESLDFLNWSPALVEDSRLKGFYGREEFEGQFFRWAEPKSEIRIFLPPGKYDLELDILDHMKEYIPQKNIQLIFNDKPLKLKPISSKFICARIKVRKKQESILQIRGPRITSELHDQRDFSLPLTWLAFRRVVSYIKNPFSFMRYLK